MQRFIPFSKVDDEQRLVIGLASDETPDSAAEIVDYQATKKAVSDWSQWRNIREMHGPSAVGVAENIILDDTTRTFTIAARVVDDAAWAKVKAGVYKGFSIGGRKLKTVIEKAEGKRLTRIVEYALHEVSLVDRPANPSAVFTVAKREGGTMKEQLLNLLQKLRGEPDSLDTNLAELETQILALPEEQPTPITAEDVQKMIDDALAGGAFAKTEAIPEAVEGLVKAEQLDELSGVLSAARTDVHKLSVEQVGLIDDLAKAIATVEQLGERLATVEKSAAGQGPVLREIGSLMAQPGGQEAVLKSLFDESDDPNLRQAIGHKLAEMQIRAAKGNHIGL